MQKEIIDFFDHIQKAYHLGQPFVIYRHPLEKRVFARVQKTNKLHKLTSYKEAGFVLAPFSEGSEKVFFPESECIKYSTLINDVNDLKISSVNKYSDNNIQQNNAAEAHISRVIKAVQFIKNGQAEKVVLSRKEVIQFSKIHIIDAYKKALAYYSNAMVYLWFHPKIGLWMGATPERLINCKKNEIKTMALAGTKSYKGTTEVEWPKKEIQEQQFVTEYILSQLKHAVDTIKIKGPYTVKAGNLLHLRTDISGILKPNRTIENLIDTLHPTPAVCGLPKEQALGFILDNEDYNRSYYSGYLGELNINDATKLYVNLRCMQLKNNYVSIYVGGGITIDSDPQKEWEETGAKASVIKKVLS